VSFYSFARVAFLDEDGNKLPRQPLIEFVDVSIVNDSVNGRLVITPSSSALQFVSGSGNGSIATGTHLLWSAGEGSSRALPAATTANARVGVTAIDDTVIVTPDGSDTIQGEADFTLNINQMVVLQSDGAGTWWIVSSYLPA
jgi:hypothetical protein